jgi:chemotaxis protein CheD
VNIVVSISDAKASNDAAATIVTYSLGSCIGVSVHDPVAGVGGMLHYQLPTSTMDAERARQCPTMFADTGFDFLLKEVERRGAVKKRLKVKLAGAAQMFDDKGVFNIGKRNHTAIRKILWQHGMLIDAEDIGGSTPRTVYLAVADGAVTIKAGGATKAL